ncbi:MAG: class III signal peptide-containing protein [archaeon]|jgi:hypothetical protein
MNGKNLLRGQALSRAQGAIEYLLLLAAAIVVVAVVISFMVSTIGPVQDTGSIQTYDYMCKTLDSNSLICGCYLCDKSLMGVGVGGSIQSPSIASCTALSESKNDPLLAAERCTNLT